MVDMVEHPADNYRLGSSPAGKTGGSPLQGGSGGLKGSSL
jgi:hypothetical protein